MIRSANVVWHGTGKEGAGTLSTLSGAIKDLPYSFKARFVDESGMSGTNPEELIAAAHAGCFTMATAVQLSNAGFAPEELKTESKLTMEPVNGANTITKIHLTMNGRVPAITNEQFQELATKAKEGCPVSRLLKAEITLTATLA